MSHPLLGFIESCLNADEAIANEVSGRYEEEPGPGVWVHDDDHRHDSLMVTKRAVLATVAAHRAILREHVDDERGYCSAPCIGGWDWAEGVDYEEWPCSTVRALVSAYAGREGYQSDWGPT